MSARDGSQSDLPTRVPGKALAAAETAEAEQIIAGRDVQIAAAVRNETPKGGVY